MSDGRDLEPRHASDGVACTAGPDGGPCVRCTGFQPGNEHRAKPGNELATVTHGAYSDRRLIEAAEAAFDALKRSIEPWDDAYETLVRALAEIRARKDIAFRYLDTNDLVDAAGEVRPILKELPRWEAQERKLANDLALSVRARAEIDLTRAQGLVALADVEATITAVVGAANKVVLEVVDAHVSERRRPAFVRAFRALYLDRIDAVVASLGPGELPSGGGGRGGVG